MVIMNSGVKMPGDRQCPRVDTYELKLRIERKVGQQKAEKYYSMLSRYLSLKMSKSEFDKFCVVLLGRENICLHNALVRGIIRNACTAKMPPPKDVTMEASFNSKVSNVCQRGSFQSLCRDVFPQSPRKGRTPNLRDRRFRDRPSPLGPHGKTHSAACEDFPPKVLEQQSATELLSLGSKPPVEGNSVEEGEEVEQATGSPGIHSRSPVTAPLGISLNAKGTRKVLYHGSAPLPDMGTCYSSGELPDASLLMKRLEQKLETEGLKMSTDCVNVLNNGLDVFLKRLIKPCLDLAGSKSQHKHILHQAVSVSKKTRTIRYNQKPSDLFSVSMLDFRTAMESNPRMLGEDWPTQLEKVSVRSFESL
ncbi:uncharacterized protein LOC107759553 [Nicotiana tabacum]|uniref:Uncharacterized protein LOC107759553 n=1 Tax=Nicotiana tabacum TaxID=4097 RepID=A0A1S3WZM5_TOBAC|nr:uncharacterized protein LOC104099249 [Nicotiana tomentosiformis]XP_016433003.1 PREDICTED: uncharacterized protein LOC107759553 [Nicotiana tabacum]